MKKKYFNQRVFQKSKKKILQNSLKNVIEKKNQICFLKTT